MDQSLAVAAPQQQIARADDTDRSQWIGGSDISAICGINPWKTPYDVWLEKTHRPRDDKRTAAEEERLYFGKLMEPVILQALAEREGVEIFATNRRFIHSKLEWARAEIDAEGYGPQHPDYFNIECKNVSVYGRKQWGEAGSGDAPDYYVAQALWGQAITERDYTLAAAFFGGSSLSTFGIERDDDVIGWLFEQGERFWIRNVLRDIPPEPRTKEDAQRLIAKMPGFRWMPGQDSMLWIDCLRDHKKRIAELKKEADFYEDKLLCSFTAAETVQQDADGKYSMVDESGNVLATWNRTVRKGYTAVIPETSYHVLRIKGESNG